MFINLGGCCKRQKEKMIEREVSAYLIGGLLATLFSCVVFTFLFDSVDPLWYLAGFGFTLLICILIKEHMEDHS